jgi:hypothetical protein
MDIFLAVLISFFENALDCTEIASVVADGGVMACIV